MEEYVKLKLDEANKFIFVRNYERAFEILDNLIQSNNANNDFLVHLRRIELAIRLDRIESICKQYHLARSQGNISQQVYKICVALAEQQGGLVEPTESTRIFRSLLDECGVSSVAYFGLACSLENQGNYEHALFNYEQSIKLDANWYPSYFGLSQIYYHLDNEIKGDYYFYLFEKHAPFNLYGNFETHKILSEEFLSKREFSEAEIAMTSLSDWWLENKGSCPLEIKIYECLILAKISAEKNDTKNHNSHIQRALMIAEDALRSAGASENTLYFIAKALEEYGHTQLAMQFYKKILKTAGTNIQLLQKIGGQFLAMGEFNLAKELFEDAYKTNPDNEDVRFCLLVVRLQLANCDIEQYLIDRERLKHLLEEKNDKVEILSLLHSLLARFGKDPYVLGVMGDIYLKLGNIHQADFYYEKMYENDHESIKTTLTYLDFILTHGDYKIADDIINKLKFMIKPNSDEFVELLWQQARLLIKTKEYQEAHIKFTDILKTDPWNIAYLVNNIFCLIKLRYPDRPSMLDQALRLLMQNEEDKISWLEYDRVSQIFINDHQYEIAYNRYKVAFLYSNGDESNLKKILQSASLFDAKKAYYDLIRLLNTNFDHPGIYCALGALAKDLWQHENACMWFEQVLLNVKSSDNAKKTAYIELADSYVWLNQHLDRSIEYIRLALETPSGEDPNLLLTKLAHAYLRKGDVRQAQSLLDQCTDQNNFETKYLAGLLQYRNGFVKKAKFIWKPLISQRVEGTRNHYLKQDLLKYYFDEDSYFKAN